MQPIEDSDLLRQYAESSSDEAFATLVTRHINLVYSVALRHVGNPHNAEEITQVVFIILAKKAAQLREAKALSGWLFQVTRLTANNFVRSESRRHRREQEAHMQSILNEPEAEVWPRIAPLLDTAVAGLREKDRQAIVLRFYEGRNLREVGLVLGAGEDAAEKRISRALEKLRNFFTKRGVVSTTAIIAGAISANSVQAAPVVLAKSVTAMAIAKGAVASASTLTLIKGALKIMAWTKMKAVIVVSAGILLAAGTAKVTVNQIQINRLEASWQVKEIRNRGVLQRMPHLMQILPTKFTEGGGIDQVSGNKAVGLYQSVADLIAFAYGGNGFNQTRMLIKTELPPEKYDFINTQGSMAALQQEIKNKFGLVARREWREKDVLLLEVGHSGATGLKPTSGRPERNTLERDGHIVEVNATLSWGLCRYLEEPFFKIPVIDQTGLTGRYDFDLAWEPDPKHDNLKKALADQLGLELIPSRKPIEMLVVEKAQ